MAEQYVTLSSLKHYDGKIKEVIATKQDQLVGTEGQVVSFDADGNAIAIDFEGGNTIEVSKEEGNQITTKNDGLYVAETDLTNYVEKEDGKGLSSNDLTERLLSLM